MNPWKMTILAVFWFVTAAFPAFAQLERVVAEAKGIL